MRFFVVLFILLAACQKKETAATTDKPLASSWKSTSNSPAWIFDLSKSKFSGSFTMRASNFISGQVCESTAIMWAAIGSQNTDYGTLSISGSTEITAAVNDPACSRFDGTWDYALGEGSTLTICPSANQYACVEFE